MFSYDSAIFNYLYGLSYTDFEFSNMKTDKVNYSVNQDIDLNLTVQNIGNVTGKETVQIYIQALESTVFRPEKELKAHKKLELKPGEKRRIKIVIDIDDLAYYDADKNQWSIERGPYKIMAGSSSRDIQEITVVNIK